jgi:tRNA1(Val) A37 N6-methylase TrmN6
VRELEKAAQPEPPTREEEIAQRAVAEFDAKLRQHRAALEAGADSVLIASWIKETQAKRAAAEA